MKYRSIAKHALFEAALSFINYDEERLEWFVGRPVTEAEYDKIMSAINKEYEAWRIRLVEQGIII